MRRVLLVSYQFPPKVAPGVFRPLKLASYVAREGWHVDVLTVEDPPTPMIDEALLAELPDEVSVHTAWSLEPTRLVQWWRRRWNHAPAESTDAAGRDRGYTKMPTGFVRLLQSAFLPDEKIGWLPYARREARRIRLEVPFDAVIASEPPFSVLKAGSDIAREARVPWVADVRDPIVGNYFYRPLTPLHARYLRRYEATMLESAAAVLTTTPGFARAMSGRHPSVTDRIHVLPNGFDPTDFGGPPPARADGAFHLAYVGTFQGAISADVLLEAVAQARAEEDAFRAAVRVRLVGPRDSGTDAAVERTGLTAIVDRTGRVPHAEAVTAMRSADVLVLVLGADDASRDIYSAKLPEYLAAGRPVLGLVPEGVAATVLREAGHAKIVDPTDVSGVKVALLELFRRHMAGTPAQPDPAVVSRFDISLSARRLTEILAELVENRHA